MTMCRLSVSLEVMTAFLGTLTYRTHMTVSLLYTSLSVVISQKTPEMIRNTKKIRNSLLARLNRKLLIVLNIPETLKV